ncbi:YidH family protein [Gordonia terrae]|uniref:YidH family protein n=1 Tax=Gordonia terrae TaxID=2055 RepID=UPI003F6D41C5
MSAPDPAPRVPDATNSAPGLSDDTPPRPPGSVDARFTLAAERTMLAWVRTALGFMAAGIAVVYLAPDQEAPALDVVLGVVMVGLGAVLALLGAWRWRRTTTALVSGGEMPGPRQVLGVVAAIVVVAILVAVVMVLQS